MLPPTPTQCAALLIAEHGRRSRQLVVDEIVIAIKAHDLDRAKEWDRIGWAVDSQLADLPSSWSTDVAVAKR